MAREIVLDTETTGMNPVDGDRLVEIGCVELENHMATGRVFHIYINPERDVPLEAVAVHGLTTEFLKDKPVFGEVIEEFLNFIGNDRLIIHNAEFDMKFINYQLKEYGWPSLDPRRVVDTLPMARAKFPGSPANLDALCRRFSIDNAGRVLHGALLDAQLLAEVYLELLGGRQRDFGLGAATGAQQQAAAQAQVNRPYREPRTFEPTAEERALHAGLVGKLSHPLWKTDEAETV